MHDPERLLTYAQERVTLKKVAGEYKGPCPVCGGTDRFAIFNDLSGWLCRKCTPKPGESIATGGYFDLIARVEGIDVTEAMRRYGDRQPPKAQGAPKQPERATATGAGDWQTEMWQLKARSYVAESETKLAGSEGVQYLSARGITEETARAWRFGFDPSYPITWEGKECTKRGPAIIMPWLAKDGKMLTAVKARLIHETDKALKARNRRGGAQMLIGAHLMSGRRTLIACEGELNATSIWQVACENCDVLSFGHEGNYKHLGAVLPLFESILVWVDRVDVATAAKGYFQEHYGAAVMKMKFIHSPGELDANDVLVQYGPDDLRKFLSMLIA